MAHLRSGNRLTRSGVALALILAVAPANHLFGATTASWLTPTSGYWSTPSRWSSNPDYPYNTSDKTYDAVISAIGSNYTVTLDRYLYIDALVLDSANATLNTAGNTINAKGPMDIRSGTLLLNNCYAFCVASGNINNYANIIAQNGVSLGYTDFSCSGLINNYGTISASSGFLSLTGLRNYGTLSVSNTNLQLYRDWSNSGAITLLNSTMSIYGECSTASLQGISLTNSALTIAGTINNADATLVLDSFGTSSWPIGYYGIIRGGKLAALDPSGLKVKSQTGGGTLDGVTLDADLNIQNGFYGCKLSGVTTLNQHNIVLSDGCLYISGDAVIQGNGEVILNTLYAGCLTIPSGNSLVIGPNVTVRTDSSGGNIAGQVINQGLIWSKTAGQTLTLNGNWTNQGLIKVTEGTLVLDGTYSTADIGTIQKTGGLLKFQGTLNNQGATFGPNASTGDMTFNGIIHGGTLVARDGAKLIIVNSDTVNYFDGVTLASDFTLNQSCKLAIQNGLGLQGARLTLSSGSFLAPLGDQTISGTGSMVTSDGSYLLTSSGTLTIGPGITIKTIGGNIGAATATSSAFINQGLICIDTPNTTLHLSGPWKNQGTVSLSGGTLELSGILTAAEHNSIQQTGGKLLVTGTLENDGETFVIPAKSSTYEFRGTIDHGTIMSAAPTITQSLLVLNGVTLAGDFTAEHLSLNEGLTLAPKSHLQLNGILYGGLIFNDAQTLGGQGEIVAGTGSTPHIIANTLTIGPGVAIRTGINGIIIDGTFTNQGLISAETPGQMVSITSITWSNQGRLSVSNGASMKLGGVYSTTDIGTLDLNGGNLILTGAFNNSATLTISGASNTLSLEGVTVYGGTLRVTNGAAAYVTATSQKLDNALFDADVTINAGATLALVNGANFTPGHTITLGTDKGGGGLQQAGTLAPATQILLASSGNNNTLSAPSGSTLIIPPTASIRALTGGGSLGMTGATLINQGLISLEAPSRTTTLAGTWSNTGTINLASGTLAINGTITTANLGCLQFSGGTLAFSGTLNNTASAFSPLGASGLISLAAGSTLRGGVVNTTKGLNFSVNSSSGTTTFDGVLFNADINVLSGTLSLTNSANFTAGHTLTLGSGANAAILQMAGTLPDFTKVIFNSTSSTHALRAPSGATLIIPAAATISATSGGGDIGGSSATLINYGVINLDASGCTTNLYGTWMNSGTINLNKGSLKIYGGTHPTSDLGTMNFNGGSLVLSAIWLNNDGAVFAPTGTTGTVWISGTIQGGTVRPTSGISLAVGDTYNSSLTLNNAILDADVLVTNTNDLNLSSGTLAPNHTITLGSSTGPGRLVFKNALPENTRIITNMGSGSLWGSTILIPSSATVQATTGNLQIGGDGCNSWQNQGTITLNGSGRTYAFLSPWSSTGSINLSDGTLELGGAFSTASFRTIHQTGGKLLLKFGTLDNTGETLTLDAATMPLELSTYGGITGGTLRTLQGYELPVTGAYASLTQLTLDADIVIRDGGNLTLGATVPLPAGRTLRLATNSSSTALLNPGGYRIMGNGTILFDGTGSGNTINPSADFIIDPGISIRTGTNGGTIGYSMYPFTNNGLISAETNGRTINLYGTTVTNNGTISATNGSTIYADRLSNSGTINVTNGGILTIYTLNNSGNVLVNGGTVKLYAAINNSGNMMLSNATLGLYSSTSISALSVLSITNTNTTLYSSLQVPATIDLAATPIGPINLGNNARIIGPTTLSTSVPLNIASSTSVTFDQVTVTGNLLLGNGSTLTLTNSSSLYGASLSLGSTGTLTTLTGDFSSSSGLVTFDGVGTLNRFLSSVIGPNLTLRTSAASGSVGASTSTLTNKGVIEAITPLQSILVLGSSITNQGPLRASDCASLSISGLFSNSGLIQATTGATLTLPITTINTGTISVQGANVILPALPSGSGSLSIGNSIITLAGSFTPEKLAALPLASNTLALPSGGVIDATTTPLTLIPATPLLLRGGTLRGTNIVGTGTIVFAESSSTLSPASGSSLTLGSGLSIRIDGGAGTLGTSNATTNSYANILLSEQALFCLGDLHNYGSFVANNATLTFASGFSLTNTGTFTLNNTTLNIQTSTPLPASLTIANSTLILSTAYTSTQFSTLPRATNTLVLATSSSLANDGAILPVSASSPLRLRGGTITGGTLSSTDGSVIVADQGSSTLGSISLAAPLQVSGCTLTIRDSLTLTQGSINIQSTFSTSANLSFYSSSSTPSVAQGITGTGDIVFNGASSLNTLTFSRNGVAAPNLLLDTNITLRTGLASGTVTATTGILTNRGTISAQTCGKDITLNVARLEQLGILEAVNGATIHFTRPFSFNNSALTHVGVNSAIFAYSMTQSADATLQLDLPTRATDRAGVLTITGSAILQGTLDLEYDPFFAPSPGTAYTLLNYTSRTGEFTSILHCHIGNGLYLEPTYTPTTLTFLAKQAPMGDATFDGEITMDDYLAIDTGYLFGGSGWESGDFDGDGQVTINDYRLMDTAFVGQMGQAAEPILQLHASWFGADYTIPVPEPASLSLLGLGAITIRRRRFK